MEEDNEITHKTIVKFVSRLEHWMSGYIDSAWLRAMVQAKNNGGWRTLGKDNLLIAALACSKNYFAPAHKDNDFFFSAHHQMIM